MLLSNADLSRLERCSRCLRKSVLGEQTRRWDVHIAGTLGGFVGAGSIDFESTSVGGRWDDSVVLSGIGRR